jgi:putative hydrolase of the HAD superfamily
MIRGIFFDLDMCIFNTHTLRASILDPVFDVLHTSSLSVELQQKIKELLFTTSLDDTATLLNLPHKLVDDMREVYQTIEIQDDDIKTFGDESCIENLPIIKILVTSGFLKLQESKIEKLNIRHLFDDIVIDAIDVPEKRRGKKRIFMELIEKYSLKTNEVLIVGDNPHSELAAGKELHIKTVQTLRPTVTKWDGADYHIESLAELSTLVS